MSPIAQFSAALHTNSAQDTRLSSGTPQNPLKSKKASSPSHDQNFVPKEYVESALKAINAFYTEEEPQENFSELNALWTRHQARIKADGFVGISPEDKASFYFHVALLRAVPQDFSAEEFAPSFLELHRKMTIEYYTLPAGECTRLLKVLKNVWTKCGSALVTSTAFAALHAKESSEVFFYLGFPASVRVAGFEAHIDTYIAFAQEAIEEYYTAESQHMWKRIAIANTVWTVWEDAIFEQDKYKALKNSEKTDFLLHIVINLCEMPKRIALTGIQSQFCGFAAQAIAESSKDNPRKLKIAHMAWKNIEKQITSKDMLTQFMTAVKEFSDPSIFLHNIAYTSDPNHFFTKYIRIDPDFITNFLKDYPEHIYEYAEYVAWNDADLNKEVPLYSKYLTNAMYATMMQDNATMLYLYFLYKNLSGEPEVARTLLKFVSLAVESKQWGYTPSKTGLVISVTQGAQFKREALDCLALEQEVICKDSTDSYSKIVPFFVETNIAGIGHTTLLELVEKSVSFSFYYAEYILDTLLAPNVDDVKKDGYKKQLKAVTRIDTRKENLIAQLKDKGREDAVTMLESVLEEQSRIGTPLAASSSRIDIGKYNRIFSSVDDN